VTHPQRFIYQKQGECARQDQVIAATAEIARVSFIKRYYNDQKWRTILPSNFPRMIEKKFCSTPSEQLQSDRNSSNASGKAPMNSMSKLTTSDESMGSIVCGYWDSFFQEKSPSSAQEPRGILPSVGAPKGAKDSNRDRNRKHLRLIA
jgi:hypothetical protein